MLRRSGVQVRLIVGRSVPDPATLPHAPHAPVVPTHLLSQQLDALNEALRSHDQIVAVMTAQQQQQDAQDSGTFEQQLEIIPTHNAVTSSSPAAMNGDVTDAKIEPEVEYFTVELAKGSQGLGITIAGYVGDPESGMKQ